MSKPFKDWRDAKIFVLEDMIVYSSVLIADVLYDVLPWVFTSHPLSFGLAQTLVFISFGALLFRKWQQWEIYR